MWFNLAASRAAADKADRMVADTVARLGRCRLPIHFSFGKAVSRSWLDLVADFAGLARAKAVWSIGESSRLGTPDIPIWATALRRSRAFIGPCLVDGLDAGLPALTFRAIDGRVVHLLPGLLLIQERSEWRSASLLDLDIGFSEMLVVETGDIAGDVTVHHRVWEKANQDGSQDRRHASNRQLPVIRYGLLRFVITGTLDARLLIGDPRAADAFVGSFKSYQRALSASPNMPDGAGGPSVDFLPRQDHAAVAVQVPTPPPVSRAHEYTAALAVALCLSIGLPPGLGQVTVSPDPPPVAAFPQPRLPEVSAQTPQTLPAEPLAAELIQPSHAVKEVPMATSSGSVPEREQIRIKGGANVRAAPSSSGATLRTVSGGTRLTVFGRSGGWVRVGEAEPWGWVHSSLMETPR